MRRHLYLAACLLVLGCGPSAKEISLKDLTPDELQVVERYVILERARTVTMANPPLGVIVLDSLSSAWGDSMDIWAESILPRDPQRAAQIQDLISRILAAEADSLVHAPEVRRLSEPLPEGF